MKASVLRYAAIGMASLSMAGFAAASTVTVGQTGADSNNQVKLTNHSSFHSTNTNVLGVNNFNGQASSTGDVHATKNTTVSGASGSGDASNDNNTSTDATVVNTPSAGSMGALAGMSVVDPTVNIHDTGADSNNTVKVSNSNKVTTTNTNVVNVNNVNLQSAQSGNVNATKNTTVGGLTSGSASNSSTTSSTVTIHN